MISHSLEKLFNAHFRSAAYVAEEIVHSKSVAEDIVQEVFVRLARVDLVRNAALDYAGTHTLRRWEELNGSELIADEVNFDLSRDDVERANRLHRLYQAIERLPEQSRRVVKLICLNNYSYADAASELGVSLATIKTHMYRSIKSLRKMMALFFF